MPRILRILNRLAVGGPVLNATYLTKYMAPDFETLFVVGEKEDHEKNAGFLAEQLGIEYTTIDGMGRSISPGSDYFAYQKVKKLIREFRPDIVHTHAAKPGAIGRLAASAMGVPAIVHTFHGHVFHSYFNSFKTNFFINTERFLARKSSAIVAISEQQKKELSEDFKIAPPEKFHVIPLGFDLDRFRMNQEEKRTAFRTEFNLAEDEIAIDAVDLDALVADVLVVGAEQEVNVAPVLREARAVIPAHRAGADDCDAHCCRVQATPGCANIIPRHPRACRQHFVRNLKFGSLDVVPPPHPRSRRCGQSAEPV